jgi:hypothetical protein
VAVSSTAQQQQQGRAREEAARVGAVLRDINPAVLETMVGWVGWGGGGEAGRGLQGWHGGLVALQCRGARGWGWGGPLGKRGG